MGKVIDPLKLSSLLWPSVAFYSKQKDVIYSVVENVETFVVAGNMLGKDFVSAFIALWFFLSRHPVKVVTTSADYSQLESVLWGEIRRFLQTSKYPLDANKGGPLLINHMHLRKVLDPGENKTMRDREVCGVSYMIGKVAKKGEGMLGHHVTPESGGYVDDGLPRTLYIADEASGVDDISYERSDTWAHRKLVIGNPYPCQNFFYKGIKGGDVVDKASMKKMTVEADEFTVKR